MFKHALVQDAAYATLLRSRRQELHARIARVLEEAFPDIVETQPELLAHHYTQAGLTEQAIDYWQRAGERALKRSANLEANRHFGQGIELIKSLSPSPAHTAGNSAFIWASGRRPVRSRGTPRPKPRTPSPGRAS